MYICPVKFTATCQTEIQAALSSVSRLITSYYSKVGNPYAEVQTAQIYLPSCVSRSTSTSQAPAEILYRKFPLLSKNSCPHCTTSLLKFWSSVLLPSTLSACSHLAMHHSQFLWCPEYRWWDTSAALSDDHGLQSQAQSSPSPGPGFPYSLPLAPRWVCTGTIQSWL